MPQKHSTQNIESEIRHFLEKGTGYTIVGRDVDLVKKGIVSSFSMFQLIDFIERKFNVRVDLLRLNPNNFNSLRNIAEHIRIWTST